MKGDTISRSALKKDIREWITNCLMCGEDRTPDILRIFIDLVDKQSTVAAAPEWISTEEKLPDIGRRVLLCAGEFIGEGFRRDKGDKYLRDGMPLEERIDHAVTHWMPLPQPPKEDEGE